MSAEITRIGPNKPSRDEVLNMLREAISDIEAGRASCNKALLVLLDDQPLQRYDVNWHQAGMQAGECIALMRVAELFFFETMGVLGGDR